MFFHSYGSGRSRAVGPGPYLVVALRVEAVVVLAVLVGTVDVATVLTAREPAEGRGQAQATLRPASRTTLPGPSA